MHYFMEPKQQLSDSIRFIQSTFSLELPSTTGNSKCRRKRMARQFLKRKGDQT